MQVEFHITFLNDHLRFKPGTKMVTKDWVAEFVESPNQRELRQAVRSKLPQLKELIFEDGLVWSGSVCIGKFATSTNQTNENRHEQSV
jgi:hypothetical protein